MKLKLLCSNEFILAVIIVILALVIGINNPVFLTFGNFITLLKSSIVMYIFALCVTIVMVSGGIDVSFPAIAATSSYVTVLTLLKTGYNGSIFFVFLMSALIGMALGLINAIIIYEFKVPTLIATLSTSAIYVGAIGTYLGGLKEIYQIPAILEAYHSRNLITTVNAEGIKFSLPESFLILVVLTAATWFVLRYTYMGRGIYSIGGSKKSARRAGYNLRLISYFIYIYVGLMSGIAGIIFVTLLRASSVRSFLGQELIIIAAVAMGGARITGGKGSVLGAILGITIIVIIKNSLILLGITSEWQTFFIGVFILLGIGVSAYRNKQIA